MAAGEEREIIMVYDSPIREAKRASETTKRRYVVKSMGAGPIDGTQ